MAQVYTSVTVSLTKQTNIPVVDMPKADNGRGLDIFITDDIVTSETGVVDNTLSAMLFAEKPSGLMVSLSSNEVIRFDNTDTYEVKFNGSDAFANMLSETGIVKAQISLMSGSTYVTTFNIYINVVDNIAMQVDVKSTQEFKNAIEVINAANAKISELNEYISRFQEQLKLTVNVRSGTADPTVLNTDKAGDIYIKVES
ncbi:hypothetical protein DXD51_03030 [Eubacterium sp. TM05-53]|nr:hypothetical protein DXD51_03030 [Eubacterium sp. TM05-53]